VNDIFSTLFAVLLLVFAGHILWRRQFVPVSFWDGLSKICYWILFPCLLYDLVSTLNLNAPFLLPFVATIFIISAVAVTYGFFSGWLLSLSGPTTSSLIQGSLRFNSFLMLAFVQGAFGAKTLQIGALSVAILVPITNIVSVLVIFLLRYNCEDTKLSGAIFTELARNPLIGAIVLGGTVNALGTPVPEFIIEMTGLLGRASLPMLLLCVGASLRVSEFKAHTPALILAILSKLLILPSVTIFAGMLFGLEKEVLLVLVVLATVPTAASTYTLAQQLGGDAPLMAEIITVQTITSVLAIPGWIMVVSLML
jgi:malonate transporter